jgi:hypothetical protein
MRVRDHVAISSAGAALLYPVVGRAVVGGWVASILIDADHYLWFCLKHRSVNPAAAMRFFNQPEAPQDAETRILHNPLALSIAIMLAARRRNVLPVAIGMTLHVALDWYHEMRMDATRNAALERDGFRCQSCGANGPVVTHVTCQPRLLPSYRVANLVVLCPACHQAAHARGMPPARSSATG